MFSRFMFAIMMVALGVGNSAEAATTYLIDFGTTGVQTSTDGSGNAWNNLTGANADATTNPRSGSVALKDITGVTGFAMAYSFPTTGSDPNFSNKNATAHSSFGSKSNLGLLNVDSATRDVIWSSGPMVYTFGGLDSALDYSFNLFVYRDYDRTSNYVLTGSTSSGNVTQNVQTTIVGDGSLLTFSNYKPDTNGNITLQVSAGTGGYAYLSAMQITVTPEPGKAMLLMVGIMAGFSQRRRSLKGSTLYLKI